MFLVHWPPSGPAACGSGVTIIFGAFFALSLALGFNPHNSFMKQVVLLPTFNGRGN